MNNALIEIIEFNDSKGEKISQYLAEPPRADEEELLIITQGTIEHFIDLENVIFHAPLINFVGKGKTNRIKIKDNKADLLPKGWLVRFKSELIIDSRFMIYANYHGYVNIPIQSSKELSQLIIIIKLIDEELKASVIDYAIISSLLNSLFVMIERERQNSTSACPASGLPQNITFHNFLKLLETNFRKDASVEFYATQLNVSPRNLNQICQTVLRKNVSEIIEIRKLTEAKSLLMKTDKSISEIGYELGYNENAYFTNVFKKKIGLTPSEFRNKINKLMF